MGEITTDQLVDMAAIAHHLRDDDLLKAAERGLSGRMGVETANELCRVARADLERALTFGCALAAQHGAAPWRAGSVWPRAWDDEDAAALARELGRPARLIEILTARAAFYAPLPEVA